MGKREEQEKGWVRIFSDEGLKEEGLEKRQTSEAQDILESYNNDHDP